MTTFETTQNVRALSMPAVLHMVCGKIGAGKSTRTKRLAAEPMTVPALWFSIQTQTTWR